MKVKIDFVTNSSSTIYIVYIPKDYPITLKKMVDAFNDQKNWSNPEDFEPYNTTHQINNEFTHGLNFLKNGEPLYSSDTEVPFIFWCAIRDVLTDEGLIIADVETGSSGQNCLFPIKENQVNEFIKLKTLYGGDE
jgi:hypothetical protein